MVAYAPQKRSATQPPTSGARYAAIMKAWNQLFASRSGRTRWVARYEVRIERIP